MTTTDACSSLVTLVRSLAAARRERAAWRLVALRSVRYSSELVRKNETLGRACFNLYRGPHIRHDLFAATGSPEHRPAVDRLLPRLLEVLDGRGWVSARHLTRELGTDDRSLREAAHLSEGQVIFGQCGHHLTRKAGLEEIEHAQAWLLSQSPRMQDRALAIGRVRHGRAA